MTDPSPCHLYIAPRHDSAEDVPAWVQIDIKGAGNVLLGRVLVSPGDLMLALTGRVVEAQFTTKRGRL